MQNNSSTMHAEDTICALSTAPGQGAIALVRLSGPEAISLADNIFYIKGENQQLKNRAAGTIHYGHIISEGKTIDDVMVSLFRAPHSYTGEDTVEISCHGSTYIQQRLLELLIQQGARLAKPGEYTMRAFLNGKLDLSQAEGVADLIASGSAAAHRLAIDQIRGGFSQEIAHLRQELLQFISLIELELDFSEEDVEFADRGSLTTLMEKIESVIGRLISSFEYGNAIKNGVPVAIIGPTNAGKSTLLNRLLREEKAIVSEIAGTTRDYIEDTIVLQGIQFRFIDTAGLRQTIDAIEKEGISRSMKKFEQASIVLIMIDPSENLDALDESLHFLKQAIEQDPRKTLMLVINKVDTLDVAKREEIIRQINSRWKEIPHQVAVSALDGTGIEELESLLVEEAVGKHTSEQEVVVSNVRHFEALKHAHEALRRAYEGLQNGLPSDLMAQDIREVLHYLGEITGEITTDEILGNIFKNFCIGK